MKAVLCSCLLAVGLSLPAFAAEPPKGFDEAAWQAEWNAGDTDGDGRLSRAEIEAANPRTLEIFDQIDTDRDGFISPDEDKAELFKDLRRRQAAN